MTHGNTKNTRNESVNEKSRKIVREIRRANKRERGRERDGKRKRGSARTRMRERERDIGKGKRERKGEKHIKDVSPSAAIVRLVRFTIMVIW